jgi:2',3'-cyclic-nucleotide 2'-phosphodiesterase (5'-nucleotidase family)
LTLNGEQLTNLFRRLGKGHGTGVSKGLKVVYKDRELVSITYNGEPVTADKTYRIATIDYLIQGNDGYKELRNGSMLVSPRDAYANTRNIIADYFREKAAAGEQVDAQIEGRVVSE